jgi:hypothetical protein
MKSLVALVFFLIASLPASAAIRPFYQDIKLPTQVVLEKQDFGTPVAASSTRVVSGTAGNTSDAAVTLSTFTAQPDVPRNIVITPGGSTGDVAACTVVVNGTNYFGQAIHENFTFSANASTAQTGSKAFKTVTSVVFPALCEDAPYAATWSVGVGEKIGLKRCMDYAGDWAWSMVDGVYESTRATIAADASHVESNTADFNGTMNGSADFLGFFVQNYGCMP